MNEKNNDSKEVDVIILEADGKIDEKHGYGYLIDKHLKSFGYSTTIFPMEKRFQKYNQLPKDIPIIVSGGMTEVTSDKNWIQASRRYIRNIILNNQKSKPKQRQPLFGICFGAQLIAESFHPGSVQYLDNPEIGLTTVKIALEHPLFKGFPKEFQGYTFHYNQILPLDTFRLLSVFEHCNHRFIQVFEIPNSSSFGVQFHPELELKNFHQLMKTYQQLLHELGMNYNEILEHVISIPSTTKLLQNFIQITT
jgi:GMP synthase-like glutamine amidotransferase